MSMTDPQSTVSEQQGANGNTTHAPPTLTIDYDLYAQYLEDSDLTDEQKREFIETLWGIVVAFIDLGFGIHPVQQVCGQNLDLTSLSPSGFGDVLNCDSHPPKDIFSQAAGHPTRESAQRKDS